MAEVPQQPQGYAECNAYTTIIIDEALRRGVEVEVLHAPTGELRLTRGDRQHLVRESLTELCSAVAFVRCDDKPTTRRVLQAAGLHVPRGRTTTGSEADREADEALLAECGSLVVKPARGEGGQGITVGVEDVEGLVAAVRESRRHAAEVVLEERCEGDDLRVLVVAGEVVAAARRQPPQVQGDGRSSVRDLIEQLNERRRAATDGASAVPLDDITMAALARAGVEWSTVLHAGQVVEVRGTANLHTGGVIVDVTDELHPDLARAAVAVATAIGTPVAGVDLIVPAVDGPEHHVIEVNEQPGLANHEPRPTAQRFLDLLFPETA